MLDENKSKEKLVDELKRLKDDYIKLKSVLKTNKEYGKLIKNERFLSQIAMELVELPLETDIYDFLAEKLKELFKDSIILVSAYDEDSDSFRVCSISGQIETVDELSSKLGRSVLGLSVPRSIDTDLLLTGHLNRVDGLHQLFLGILSKSVCQSIEKLLCLEGIYNIGLSWKGIVYGAVDIGLKKSSKIENKEIVEVLVNMAAVVMQRRKAEDKILENEAKYRSYLDNAPYGIIVTDENGHYIEVNDMVCEITGYSKEELLKMGIPGLIPLNYLEGVTKELFYSQLTEQAALEFKFLHKNGQTRNGAIKCVKLPKKKYMGFLTDITERKKAEEELKLSRFRLENAIALANMANWEFDVFTKSFIFNDRFYTMCDTTAEREGGYLMSADDYIKEFVHPDDAQFIADAISKSGTNLEYRIIRRDGETRYIITNVKFAKDEGGNLINVYGTNQDITKRKKAEKLLKESEEKFRAIFQNANDMISLNLMNEDGMPGKFLEVNDVASERLGYTHDELLNMSPPDIVAPEKRPEMPKNAAVLIEKGHNTFEIVHLTKAGERIPVEVNNHLIQYKKRKVCLAISRDITGRKKAEEALKLSQIRLANAMDLAHMANWELDAYNRIFIFNEKFYSMLGTTAENEGGYDMSIEDYIKKYVHPEDAPFIAEGMKRSLDIREPTFGTEFEHRIIRRDGETRYVAIHIRVIPATESQSAYVYGAVQDITEHKMAEEQLKESLEDKEMLLKEIHHRVKNNLLVISSLLDLQSQYIKDEDALSVFRESQNRAKSMALIHERLYRSTDLKRIDFGDYIRTLTTDLFHTYVTDPSRVKLDMNLENILVDINTTVPLGLIVNELVTNSMKHAFPDDKSGEINIEFHKLEDEFIFTVSDTGIGFPEDIDFKNTDSLGLQLVNNLVKQIDGEIELDVTNGTEFKIKFKDFEKKL